MTASLPAEIHPARVSTLGLVRAELLKLRGSLVFPLTIAVPGLVLLLAFLIGLIEGTTGSRLLGGTMGIWAQAMLPLGVLAFTVVLAQLEHQPRAWDPLLALPGARQRIFLLKLVAAFVVLAFWHLILLLGTWLLAQFFINVMPGQIEGPYPYRFMTDTMPRIWAASLLMLVVQYALALYFRSFVPPLVIGFAGILASMGAAGSEYGVFMPWMMPLNQLATEAWRADLALALGGGGGLVGAMLMQLLMSRREW